METAAAPTQVTFETSPDRYRHWKLSFDGPVATLSMDVQQDAGLSGDYRLKLNPYERGVDIEIPEAIQRLPPQAEFLRPRRRHRARRRHPAHPLRAPRSAHRRDHEPQGARVLRGRQHLHAPRLQPRVEGQFLQVHERDAARNRGRERAL